MDTDARPDVAAMLGAKVPRVLILIFFLLAYQSTLELLSNHVCTCCYFLIGMECCNILLHNDTARRTSPRSRILMYWNYLLGSE